MQLFDYVMIFIGLMLFFVVTLVIGFIRYSVKKRNKQQQDFKVTTTYENPETLDEITIGEMEDEKVEDVKEEEKIEEIKDVPQGKEIDEEEQKKAELEKELKKYPRKQRAKLRKLYNDYQNGIILKVGENVDNAQYIAERRKQWENS